MTHGRPIGLRIRQVCETLQIAGPSTAKQVAEMCQASVFNTKKYCDRAVGHGLLTCDASRKPTLYETVPDWHKKVDKRQHSFAITPPPQPNALEKAWHSLPIYKPKGKP